MDTQAKLAYISLLSSILNGDGKKTETASASKPGENDKTKKDLPKSSAESNSDDEKQYKDTRNETERDDQNDRVYWCKKYWTTWSRCSKRIKWLMDACIVHTGKIRLVSLWIPRPLKRPTCWRGSFPRWKLDNPFQSSAESLLRQPRSRFGYRNSQSLRNAIQNVKSSVTTSIM